MANEIFASVELKADNNGVHVHEKLFDFLDQASAKCFKNIQTIGTSEEAIELGDVTAGGAFLAKNLSTQRVVKIRAATGLADLVEMKPGEFCYFRLDAGATAPFAIAIAGAAEVLFVVLDA